MAKSKPKPQPPDNTAARKLLEAHRQPLLFADAFDPVGGSPWKDYGTATQHREGRLVGGKGMLTVLETIQETNLMASVLLSRRPHIFDGRPG